MTRSAFVYDLSRSEQVDGTSAAWEERPQNIYYRVQREKQYKRQCWWEFTHNGLSQTHFLRRFCGDHFNEEKCFA